MPKVSVIISTYNRAKHYLPRAIDSVLAQTFQDFELLIVDDASPDQTAKLVRQYASRDTRVTYHCTPMNSGYQCRPKNIGLQAAKGELIAYLDDDNEWLPQHLERLVAELGDADVIYCGREYRNDPVEPCEHPPVLGTLVEFNNQPWDPQRLKFHNWIDTSDLLHKIEVTQRLQGWNENRRRTADWELMQRIAQAGFKVKHLPEILTIYYWHAGDVNVSMKVLAKPAIWTLTNNRLWDTQQMLKGLWDTSGHEFDHYVFDQGSTDGTQEFLCNLVKQGKLAYLYLSQENVGISRASNHLLDIIMAGEQYPWVVKLDQDIKIMTPSWFEALVSRWKDMEVMSPYVVGLQQHPGGAPRVSHDYKRRVGFAKHLGGAMNMAPMKAWKDFGRWTTPAPQHGLQDAEFSQRVRDKGWKLVYVEDVLVEHLGNVPDDQRARERATVV